MPRQGGRNRAGAPERGEEELNRHAIDIDGDDANEGRKRIFSISKDELPGPSKRKFVKLDERKKLEWQNVTKEAQVNCVKSVVRLFLMKGKPDKTPISILLLISRPL